MADRIGIILAGGSGSRLLPLTSAVNKQLLPVYDKPMIYYPLSTLMLASIRDVIIISQPDVLPQLRALLGDGDRLGMRITYLPQPSPDGIAQAFLIAEPLIRGRDTCLMLGDNFLFGSGVPALLRREAIRRGGATIFGYPVAHPQMFGVAVLDEKGRVLSIEEKPANPKGNLAIPGLYFYDAEAPEIARSLKPSARGELEITHLNQVYLSRGALELVILGRGSAWLDGGTPDTLFEAGQFVRVMEQRTGLKVACLEEVAFRMDFIDFAQLENLAAAMKPCAYREYLFGIIRDEKALPRS